MYNTDVALFVLRAHAVALEHGELTVEEQIAEAFDAVTLPVFYKSLELFDGFDTLFAGNGVVRASKYRGCCFNTSSEVLLSLLVEVAVLLQLLWFVSAD